MANPNIGTVICPMLGDIADVRKDKNGKLYYAGQAGIIVPRSVSGQTWLKKNAKIDGQEPKPTIIEDKPPTYNPEPTASGGGLLDGLLDSVFGGDDE